MKLNYRRTFLIGLAFLSISAFWQTYDNIIPLMLQNTFGLGETVTGVLMAMDNVLAIVLLPVFGALSDKVDTRFGKRMPFIVVGTVLAVCFYMLLAAADRSANLPLFIVTLFLLLVAMGTYRSPAVALMPDLTPNTLRSKGNAIINLMGAVGGVYSLIMIQLLVGDRNATLTYSQASEAEGAAGRMNYTPLFVSVAALMAVAVLILVLTIRERRVKEKVAQEVEQYEKANGLSASESEAQESNPAPARAMAPEVRRSMAFLLVSIFLWFTAYNAVTTAFSRYANNVWGLTDGGFASCLMIATVAAIISYIPIGQISSRIGRKKTILIGIVLMSLCYFAAIFAKTYEPWINGAFALIGVGWASINVNSYPMVVEMSKGADIGKFTGTYYTFSMAAQIFTPIFSGLLLEHISYATLFPYALAFSMAAFFTMLQVRHGDVKPAKKKSVLENFDVDD
ncbi:MAG: MFS transporter [Eubacteriales bacterium]|nr:MFS transporter [Eubacteriales bacterium]